MLQREKKRPLLAIKSCNRESIHALPKFKWVLADIFSPLDVNSIRVACFCFVGLDKKNKTGNRVLKDLIVEVCFSYE